MSELLIQFLSEARDALEGIGDKLMQLEASPDDTELMAQLFRLVHTLKGNAGLFDFPEMTRVLHAGEDLMDAVRHGRVHYSPTLADCLLDAMDFVGRLCDDLERERPHADDIISHAAALASGLRALLGTAPSAPSPPSSTSAAAPVQDVSAAPAPDVQTLCRVPESVRQAAYARAMAGQSLLWVHYRPDEQCFFQGEDPLHQSRQTPGVLWGGVSVRSDWPPLAELDAYRCLLDFDLLVAGSSPGIRADVLQHFRYVPDQITLHHLNPLTLVVPQGDPNGGPVYEDFVTDALGFVERGDVAGLGRVVRSLLDLSSPSLWLSSALRWVAVMLDAQPVPLDAIRTLIESLRTLTPPDWAALSASSAPAATQVVAQAVEQVIAQAVANSAPANLPPPPQAASAAPPTVLAQIVDVQRQILALSTPPDAHELSGRLKAVSSALHSCLYASGRTSDVSGLECATQSALQAQTAAPLAQWLETWLTQTRDTDASMPVVSASSLPAPVPTPVVTEMPPSDTGPAAMSPASHPTSLLSDTPPPDGDPRFSRRAEDTVSVKSLKVDQAKIDRLMNLIGEMVVAKNAIPYLAARAENVYGVRDLSRELKAQYAVIHRISGEMQDAIMQVRMMPVSSVMQRFPRLVRDISRRLGKQVDLVLEGQDTAADKNIIESLGDPLVHIVRNSLDHGLEPPDVRQAAGKPAVGTLKIIARQESDRVVIEISDDGRGIDPAVIKRKAWQKGLIDEATLDRISDQDAIHLIFAAGFSTVDEITDLSGRGVGMDVVRTAIERVNGSIALNSVAGRGTTISLSLPLSMAVSYVMTMTSDGQMFGVPMDSVVETVRVPQRTVRNIKSGLVTVLRGRVVPLVSLNRLLGIAAPPLANDDDELATLVVRQGDDVVGLLVDQFHGTADIILKPLAGVLGQLKMYAGSALMGDGSVLMVLNPKELF